MPDYYVKGSIVLDAKYKSPDKEESRRSDRHQIVAYMHTLKANCGGFIYPGEDAQQIQIGEPARLHGNGGTVYQLQMPIPSQAHSFNEFAQAMRNWEEELKERISNLAISP